MEKLRLTLRIDLGSGRAIGPGKIRLLEQIHKSGSITQAGCDLGLSYRRAWLLIDDLNNCFRHPVIETETGGIARGGTTVTLFGQMLVEQYHAIEADALAVSQKHLHDLEGALKSTERTGLRNSIKRPLLAVAGSR
jgi:molybdate transport system regulatory protein